MISKKILKHNCYFKSNYLTPPTHVKCKPKLFNHGKSNTQHTNQKQSLIINN